MVLAISLLLAWAQAEPTPLVNRPLGLNPEFHALADEIEAAVGATDFAKAGRLAGLLPKAEIGYAWRDDKVPAAFRPEFAEARDEAMKLWSDRLKRHTFRPSDQPDIVFAFEPELAVREESGLPAGSAHFFSTNTAKPRLEAVLGLKRGRPLADTTALDVRNEVAFAIGAYLGLPTTPNTGNLMGRTDLSAPAKSDFGPGEATFAIEAGRLAQAYRDAIAAQKPIRSAKPVFQTDTRSLELGEAIQGAVVPATVQVTNNGNGPLVFSMTPDCGCLHVTPRGTIAPGATALLRADFDTREFFGDLNRRITIATNDPAKPVLVVPVHIKILPSFRFLRTEGDVWVVSGRKSQAVVYLFLPDGSDIVPLSVDVLGLRGKARFEEWEGEMADPAMKEPPTPRTGYKFVIDLDDAIPPGRAVASLRVRTTSPEYPTIEHSLYVQKGIVALPFSVYLGQMGATPKRSTFLVARPGKSFKVLGVTSDSSFLTASALGNEAGDEYRIEVRYDGRATSGELAAVLRVRTDDPAQPVIEVPVRGSVQ